MQNPARAASTKSLLDASGEQQIEPSLYAVKTNFTKEGNLYVERNFPCKASIARPKEQLQDRTRIAAQRASLQASFVRQRIHH